MSADTEPRSASFGSQLRRGTMWSTLDVVVARFGQFALGVVIARLLAPADFGVFAVALVVHVIVIGVSELGVTAALIRDENADVRRSGPTVQTIALVTSCVLGALMALSAPVLANLLGSPRASGAIAIMAINLPLAGLAAVPAALLRRDFRMDRIFVADTSNVVATGIVVILLATHGWGPMALAWSWVAGQLLTTILMNTYKPGRFRPGWNRGEAGRLLRFGLPLAGANIISFSILNVDFVIVGRLLGATALGLYVLAFNISGWPMNVFGSVVRSVSLPSFARLRRDGDVDARPPRGGPPPAGQHHAPRLLPARRAGHASDQDRLRREVGARGRCAGRAVHPRCGAGADRAHQRLPHLVRVARVPSSSPSSRGSRG